MLIFDDPSNTEHMSDFINTIEAEFIKNANSKNARAQKAYLKNQFEFFGLTAPLRREIQKPFLVMAYLPAKNELNIILKELWEKPEREFQHFALELTFKYLKQMEEKDIELFEYMIVHKSWWDTIDFIAPRLVGEYFKRFPENRDKTIEKWLASKNIWLQRSAILFQLKYKKEIDTRFLSYVINSLLGSKEFFINKAMGWILRDYSRHNPDWVINFCSKTELSNLSRKEALRLLN